MNHNNHQSNKNAGYSIKDFLPLIILFIIILICSIAGQFLPMGPFKFNLHLFMREFMGFFFVIFGLFKVINLNNFAEAYSTYDVIAKKSKVYAYIYPFIEIFLGIAYLMNLYPKITNIITLVIMLISALGVFIELKKGKQIVCACLGTVFKIPMTYVTLFEDLLMAFMALLMLFI